MSNQTSFDDSRDYRTRRTGAPQNTGGGTCCLLSFPNSKGFKVISNLWRYPGSLVIKMDETLANETSQESKIKKLIFRYFITKLSSIFKQWTLFSILL